MTDEDFQRMTSWNFALLYQCPVDLGEVVNPEASGPHDFWKIRIEDQRLQALGKGGRGSGDRWSDLLHSGRSAAPPQLMFLM